ncbi:MAG: hypothetical protein J5J00_10460 [Deltaproteobacteria bacterium]|nr:hypothetical protein [Deltaproteobacteria bacterium]
MSVRLTTYQVVVSAAVFLVSFFSLAYLAERIIFVNLAVSFHAAGDTQVEVFWDSGQGFSVEQSSSQQLQPGIEKYYFSIPIWRLRSIRLDPCACETPISIKEISADWIFQLRRWDGTNKFEGWAPANDIGDIKSEHDRLAITPSGNDPYLVQRNLRQLLKNASIIRIIIAFLGAALLCGLCLWRFLQKKGEPSPSFDSGAFTRGAKQLSGPIMLTGALLVLLPVAYMIFRNVTKEEVLVYLGVGDDYALSFVSTEGYTLSKQRGPLRLVFDPFTLYRNFPSQESSSYTIDANGFRGGIDTQKGGRFVLIGGSAAFGQGLESDSETFAYKLSQLLPEHSVINAGVVGFLSGQELSMMVHYMDSYQPKGYIVFDGWNELFDQYLSARRRSGQFGFNNTFFTIEERLAELAKAEGVMEATASISLKNIPDDNAYLAELERTYTTNIIKMYDFAVKRGAFLLVVFQPELSIKKQRTKKEEKHLEKWDDKYGYLTSGFPAKYRQLIDGAKKTLIERDVPFIDLQASPSFRDSAEELYLDVVHLNPKGNDLVAQALHRKLSAMLSK